MYKYWPVTPKRDSMCALVKMESRTNGRACADSSVNDNASLEKKVGVTFPIFFPHVFSDVLCLRYSFGVLVCLCKVLLFLYSRVNSCKLCLHRCCSSLYPTRWCYQFKDVNLYWPNTKMKEKQREPDMIYLCTVIDSVQGVVRLLTWLLNCKMRWTFPSPTGLIRHAIIF